MLEEKFRGIKRFEAFEVSTIFLLPVLNVICHHLVLHAIECHSFLGRDAVGAGIVVVCAVKPLNFGAAVLVRRVLLRGVDKTIKFQGLWLQPKVIKIDST